MTDEQIRLQSIRSYQDQATIDEENGMRRGAASRLNEQVLRAHSTSAAVDTIDAWLMKYWLMGWHAAGGPGDPFAREEKGVEG